MCKSIYTVYVCVSERNTLCVIWVHKTATLGLIPVTLNRRDLTFLYASTRSVCLCFKIFALKMYESVCAHGR